MFRTDQPGSDTASRMSVVAWPGGPLLASLPGDLVRPRLSASGRFMFGTAADGSVVARSIEGAELWRFAGEPKVVACDLSADEQSLALAHESGSIDIVDVADGRRARRLEGYELTYDVRFSHDGDRLAVGDRKWRAHIVDLTGAGPDRHLTGHSAEVVRVEFSRDSRLLLTRSWDGTARLWDAHSGRQLLVYEDELTHFSTARDEVQFRTHSHFGVLEVVHEDFVSTLQGHVGKAPHSVAVSADGRLLASVGGDGLLLWDFETGAKLGWLARGNYRGAAFHPDGHQLLAAGGSGFRRWTLDPARPLVEPREELLLDVVANGLSLTADGRTAGIIIDNTIRVLSLETGEGRTFEGTAAISIGGTLSPDGRYVALGAWTGGGDGVRVWDTTTGELLRHLMADEFRCGAKFSDDGQYLITSGLKRFQLWRVGSWQHVSDIERLGRYIRQAGAVAFGADGRVALAMSRRAVALVDIESGEVRANLESADRANVAGLAFSADGSRLVIARAPNHIQIWELDKLMGAYRSGSVRHVGAGR